MTKLIIQVRSVFGRDLIYPINELAKTAVKLTGNKTFTSQDIETLKALGFEVELQAQNIPDTASQELPKV